MLGDDRYRQRLVSALTCSGAARRYQGRVEGAALRAARRAKELWTWESVRTRLGTLLPGWRNNNMRGRKSQIFQACSCPSPSGEPAWYIKSSANRGAFRKGPFRKCGGALNILHGWLNTVSTSYGSIAAKAALRRAPCNGLNRRVCAPWGSPGPSAGPSVVSKASCVSGGAAGLSSRRTASGSCNGASGWFGTGSPGGQVATPQSRRWTPECTASVLRGWPSGGGTAAATPSWALHCCASASGIFIQARSVEDWDAFFLLVHAGKKIDVTITIEDEVMKKQAAEGSLEMDGWGMAMQPKGAALVRRKPCAEDIKRGFKRHTEAAFCGTGATNSSGRKGLQRGNTCVWNKIIAGPGLIFLPYLSSSSDR